MDQDSSHWCIGNDAVSSSMMHYLFLPFWLDDGLSLRPYLSLTSDICISDLSFWFYVLHIFWWHHHSWLLCRCFIMLRLTSLNDLLMLNAQCFNFQCLKFELLCIICLYWSTYLCMIWMLKIRNSISPVSKIGRNSVLAVFETPWNYGKHTHIVWASWDSSPASSFVK